MSRELTRMGPHFYQVKGHCFGLELVEHLLLNSLSLMLKAVGQGLPVQDALGCLVQTPAGSVLYCKSDQCIPTSPNPTLLFETLVGPLYPGSPCVSYRERVRGCVLSLT